MSKTRLPNIAAASSFTGIDEDSFLREAGDAGVVDRQSGAYDEFHFSEEGIGQTPFESYVDSKLELVRTRLLEVKALELAKLSRAVDDMKSDLATTRLSIAEAEATVAHANEKIEHETQVLNGEKTGESGLLWSAPLPATNTRFGVWFKLAVPVIVFALASLVDLFIIFFTYFNVFSDSDINEARMFTIPAVAIQVLFPHFAGSRIGLLVRGHPRRAVLITQLILLIASWGVFVWSLQTIRMTWFSISGSLDAIVDPTLRSIAATALAWSTVMMLVGLGGWMIYNAMHDNPHVREYLKLWLRLQTAEKRAMKRKKQEAKQLGAIQSSEHEVQVASDNFDNAIENLTTNTAIAAKDVYRRAFVNSFGDTSFTAAFMNRIKQKLSGASRTEGGLS